jgi:mono/diheme cytochrome c family protein
MDFASRCVVGATVLLLGGSSAAALQAAAGQAEEAGRAVFATKCAACHSLGGNRLVGPGLGGVTARRTRDWLVRWISAPDRVLSEGDSIARRLLAESNNVPMPNLSLSPAEVNAVIAYLQTASDTGLGPLGAPASAQAPLPAGDAVVGKALFTGAVRLQNGGPPCMACHSVAGIGALGGGALGPDLTPAHAKYGDAGLAAILGNIPFPTMRPIFAGHPLTPGEQANLRAFLGQAVAVRPSRAVVQLTLLGAIGAIVLLVPVQLVWRRRLTAVRRPLVARARGSAAAHAAHED